MALTRLAEAGDFDELEGKWLSAFGALPAEPSGRDALLTDAARTLGVLRERGDSGRAKSLVEMIPGDLEKGAAPAPRLELLLEMARLKPEEASLRRRLRDLYREHYKSRAGLDRLLELAGLYDEKTSPSKVDERLGAFMRYEVGAIVRHASWGPGKITQINRFSAELVIDFVERKKHRMSPDAAVDTLALLGAEDFDAMSLVDMPSVVKMVSADPLRLLKLVIASLGGRTNLNAVKDKLKNGLVDESKWSTWWNQVKKLAFNDPYVEITEERPARLSLRTLAKSAADEAVELIKRAHNFRDRWEVTKRFFRNEAEGGEALWNALAPDLARSPAEFDLDDQVALVEACQERKLPLDAFFEIPDIAPLLLRLTAGLQRELAEGLTRRRDNWAELLGQIYERETCRIRGWIREQLVEVDPIRLAEIDDSLIHDTMRDPDRFYELADRLFSGKWVDSAATRDRHELVIGLMELARSVETRKYSGKVSELPQQIGDLLLKGDAKWVNDLVRDAPLARAERAAQLMHGTTSLAQVFVQVGPAIEARLPNLKLGVEKPFWVEALIVSRESLAKRRSMLIEMMEKDVPAAEKAIGHAQAFGDLSENSEWTAAIERRNQLVDRIEKFKREISQARELESQPLDARVVSPGTKVTIKRIDVPNGPTRDLVILGAWDGDAEHGIVSYISKLAAGLLGREVGNKVWIETPEGRAQYEVLAIELAV